uniref:Uncharacterized protein n=1 Tax=Globodera rostochiensis TaxID=31243 RepID=A0A914H4N9_GLORO
MGPAIPTIFGMTYTRCIVMDAIGTYWMQKMPMTNKEMASPMKQGRGLRRGIQKGIHRELINERQMSAMPILTIMVAQRNSNYRPSLGMCSDSLLTEFLLIGHKTLVSLSIMRRALATTNFFCPPTEALRTGSTSPTEAQRHCNPKTCRRFSTVHQFLQSIGARKEQFRKKDYTGNTMRKILLRAAEMVPLFTTEWPKTICMALAYLGKIQEFSKAQPLLPREVAELEDHMDNFKAFIVDQPQMRLLLSQKPKAHLLLVDLVPFARQHRFLGLMDEQANWNH